MTVANELLDAKQTFQERDFGLDQRLIKATQKLNYTHATLVQVHCIPLALQGKDLIVRARTGSGKTAAFALPLLHKILMHKESEASSTGSRSVTQAIILVPTRELVDQVREQLWNLMHYCRNRISLLALTGQSMSIQQALLRDAPDILISTPGRIVSHLEAGYFDPANIHSLIIDEADLILSFGSKSDLCSIFDHLPKAIQILCMSATLSPDLRALKKSVFHNAAILKLEEEVTDGKLQQFYLRIPPKDKELLLYALLKLGLLHGKILFFVNVTASAYRLKLFFEQFHIKSAVLNAEMPHNSRKHILQEYNRGLFDNLIATDESVEAEDEDVPLDDEDVPLDDEDVPLEVEDVPQEDESDEESNDDQLGDDFNHDQKVPESTNKSRQQDALYGVSRGVDFSGVKFVVNVDFPQSARSYIHRIGRTARGNECGTALSIVSSDCQKEAKTLDKLQAKQQPLITPSNDLIKQPAPLSFDLHEIDRFRYRVEDVQRAVTRIAVREAQLADIKKEILNSEKLASHFEANPRDLNVLQHDKTIGKARIQPHLATIPDYLVPIGLQVAPSKPTRKKQRTTKTNGKRRTDNDPLHSFTVSEDTLLNEPKAVQEPAEDRITYGNTGVGTSTAGRQKWKQSHRKGRFNRRTAAKQNAKKRKGFAH
uniref:RNA helicase n=1 Tax=Albugo laibachii Nc14 TaxID=890382 RepID=F0WWJ0_9STRA|nr:DEAD/DEAH box RNA helicase putative [Albugo laibachii Nc14]|eukprot:CCA25813.1 DEAD/DEAH box RNA helicase putative [Albugo laibachii Nc14]